MRDIGKNLRQSRINQKMTQDELAEKLYVTRQTVSNYETGRSRPDVETLVRISEALETVVEELIYGAKPKEQKNWRKLIIAALVCAALFGLIQYLTPIADKLARTKYFIGLYVIVEAGLCSLLLVLLGWLSMLIVQATLEIHVPNFKIKKCLYYAMMGFLAVYVINVMPLLCSYLLQSIKLAYGKDISRLTTAKLLWQYLGDNHGLMLIQIFIMEHPVLFYFYSVLVWIFKPAQEINRQKEHSV